MTGAALSDDALLQVAADLVGVDGVAAVALGGTENELSAAVDDLRAVLRESVDRFRWS